MKRNFINFSNQVDHMPLYNRSHAQNKHKSDEEIALSTHKKQIYLEKEIKSEDTLQSVSLEFNVPVAELKRINNIHKDNEIYARKIIKVPSNPLSILLEKDYFSEIESTFEKPAQDNCDVIIETINNSNSASKNSSEITAEEKEIYLTSSASAESEVQESASLLSTIVEHKTNDVMSCSGADWGISWHALIFVTVVLGLAGPLLYMFWLLWGKKEKAAVS